MGGTPKGHSGEGSVEDLGPPPEGPGLGVHWQGDPERLWLLTLDAGIRPYVEILSDAHVETFESCEGGEHHAFPEPTIRFHGGKGGGFAALAVALDFALPVADLRRSWPILDGEPTGPYWEMTFHVRARPSAADSSQPHPAEGLLSQSRSEVSDG